MEMSLIDASMQPGSAFVAKETTVTEREAEAIPQPQTIVEEKVAPAAVESTDENEGGSSPNRPTMLEHLRASVASKAEEETTVSFF